MNSRYPTQPICKNDVLELNTFAPDNDSIPVSYDFIATRQIADLKIQQKLSPGVYITTTISGFNLVTYKDNAVPTAWLCSLSVCSMRS
mmetsp:Transcript_7533/g.9686  ORF Transcript_7533/g.9686 Transcript_7533/m.9686 type:complete len:88 (-) Transcript_7533:112-375(-)